MFILDSTFLQTIIGLCKREKEHAKIKDLWVLIKKERNFH